MQASTCINLIIDNHRLSFCPTTMPQIIGTYLPRLVDTYGGTPATATPVFGTYNASGYATVKALGVIRCSLSSSVGCWGGGYCAFVVCEFKS